MKKYFAIRALLLVYIYGINTVLAQSVTNNFDSGNWLHYYSLCWGIGPNTSYYGTKVISKGFTGSSVCETDDLGKTAPCFFTTPWIKMDGNDQITFEHEIPLFDGNRTLEVSLVSYPSLSEILLWTYAYTDGNSHTANIMHSAEGYYKVKWAWRGSGGSSHGQLDNITLGGSLNVVPEQNCNP